MDQIVDQRRKLAAQDYPIKYEKVIRDWKQEGDDAFWLMYSANYLFRWKGTRWAVDPLTLAARVPSSYPFQPATDFARCDFIVLTHRHADHFDLKLLKDISSLDIPWIIPQFLLREVQENICLSKNKIIIPKVGQSIELSGITILPLEGSHWEYPFENIPEGESQHGVPSCSYLFEAGQKKWFLPGDTRYYDPTNIPALGSLNGLISHVWLGRKSAVLEPPPLLQQFCNYQLAFETQKIILTHLDEWGRDESDLWSAYHAEKILQYIHTLAPSLQITYAHTGQCVPLT